MIEHKGMVQAEAVNNNRLSFNMLSELVRKHADAKQAVLCTDEFKGYSRMRILLEHKQIDHSACVWNLNGISTDCMESFWAILKLGIIG